MLSNPPLSPDQIEAPTSGAALSGTGGRQPNRSGSAIVAFLDACDQVPHDLIILLLSEPALGGLQAARVRHVDERRSAVLQARLGLELRELEPELGDPAAGVSLPIDAGALPEPVRAVLAEEHPGPVLVVPVTGRQQALGVVVLCRGGQAPFTDLEFEHVLSSARTCGSALHDARLGAAAARADALSDLLTDAVIAIDQIDLVTQWNRAAEQLYGIRARDAIGRRLQDLVHTDFETRDELALRTAVLSGERWRGQLRQQARGGRVVEVEARVTALRGPDGQYQGMIIVNRDVTASPAERSLTSAQAGFAQDLMNALDSCAAVLDNRGLVVSANSRWQTGAADRSRCLCGPVPVGRSWLEALRTTPGPEPAALAADVARLLRGRQGTVHAECDCALAGPDVEINIDLVRVDAGLGGGAIVVLSELDGRRRPKRDELTFRATHDELTGLPNRAALMDGLNLSLARLDGTGKLAVLFCDLDGFKDINDGLGHAVGDQVLIAVARRLRQRCRSADVVARFGGDEFVVVLSITDVAQAVAMADRIVEVLDEPIVVGEAEVAPGVSVGITVVDVPPDDDDPVGTLLRDADTAMYHAKGRGRGRYELFDASLRENIEERLELAAAMHRAVGDGELEIVYQSRRYCGDRRVAGVEALLRWRHPELGLLEPDVFIPIAERTGRIIELGDWVLRHALREFAAIPDARATLAVNVSPRQLIGDRLVGTVADALAESGVAPQRLVLEITESAFVDDPVAARAVLGELRSLGVSIALDDFGTGWSSLQYLRTLPVDVLKIDRSFVADLATDLDACAVVSAVLGLGHGMGLVVVAEGVENEEHLNVLRDMGCDEYQGYLDGRPGSLRDAWRGDPPRAVLVSGG